MPPPGSQLSPSKNTAFHCIRLLSMTPWPCDMDGLLQTSHLSVTVAIILLWNMHSRVPKEVFPPSGTMKSAISQPIFSQKCVMRCALNLTCSQPRQTNCLEPLPTHRTGRGSTFRQTECGGGGRFEKTFFDVRVFNPHAPSNKNQTPAASYRKHEREKKRAYEQRIREVEHSSFTPLVFSATGGMGREATCFYKRLASMLAQKWDYPYSTTLCWLRCRLTFSLIRSAIQALRGARSTRGQAVHSPAAIDLAITESYITPDF